MMKQIVTCVVLLVLFGCGDHFYKREIDRVDNICTKDTEVKRSEFILACIKNANPKSDEEPEDWILKCREMAEDTFCVKKSVRVTQEKTCHSCRWLDANIKEISTTE